MEFLVKIHLGNDAMKDGGDIAGALIVIAAEISDYGGITADDTRHHVIKDINGATVGEWSISE